MPSIKLTEELPDANAYYYYNYVNNAIKISSRLPNDELRKVELSVILNNMHESLNPKSKIGKDEATLCAYKMAAYWVVAFKILDREICVFFNPMTPMERIEEERAKFRQNYFGSIFVL